jgi:hypothetical protein
MAIKPMKTITVEQLLARLEKAPRNAEVRVWLPGSRIALTDAPFTVAQSTKDEVLIEGNVEPGSALDF